MRLVSPETAKAIRNSIWDISGKPGTSNSILNNNGVELLFNGYGRVVGNRPYEPIIKVAMLGLTIMGKDDLRSRYRMARDPKLKQVMLEYLDGVISYNTVLADLLLMDVQMKYDRLMRDAASTT